MPISPKKPLYFILAASLALIAPLPSRAQSNLPEGFNPNAVLTDDDIFNASGLSYERMVNFLRSRGTLANYQTRDIDGQLKTAPEIIWRVAQSYKINPKYLLALLQKEQSLVEDPLPKQSQYDWATGFGVCDDCRMDDPAIQDFKGFAAQLEWAAKQHREKYLIQLLSRGTTIGGQGKGKTVTIDGMSVTPANKATAMLYSYTPHLQGNYNLWRIWQRWFSLRYPEGTVVRATQSGKIYVLRLGEKRPFASRAVAQSLVDESKIVSVSDTDLQSYPTGASIKFPLYSLLRDPQGKIYLLTRENKRHIVNLTAFRNLGFNEDEIEEAEASDLEEYPDGPPITPKTTFPQGALMRSTTSTAVWYVEGETRHALTDATLLKLYFPGRPVRKVKPSALEKYPIGDPYKLHDGELVRAKDAPSVYVVENGVLRPILSAHDFESVGWKWKNVVMVNASLLKLHPVSEPFQANLRIELTNG